MNVKSGRLGTIGVVGAGQMGRGIAQVSALADLCVVLHDTEQRILEAAKSAIDASLQAAVGKGKISQVDMTTALHQIGITTKMHDLGACDFVIEAVTESLSLKQTIFESLDGICRKSVVLASNTSSISITRLAAATRRPTRVIGMHFMNPGPVMKLVEIIVGQRTEAAVVEETRVLVARLGKTPVISQDLPGFISNRILMPMINEAICALYERVGTKEDIDAVMTLGMRHPMGPLALADLIGLDTCLAIMEVLHEGFGDSKYRPCPLLRRMVDAGLLGRKTGHGFYEYGNAPK
ncbi:MAG: 3-hydroxyacyl-CoA dehydrogenase NAD-binding domain-containing protein [Acidobacteria bacterium]|nr:3-hydroxyacyl-CoA dehydrogenase NAD-binding domain-containing protein [Acidobacteriota bacterium]